MLKICTAWVAYTKTTLKWHVLILKREKWPGVVGELFDLPLKVASTFRLKKSNRPSEPMHAHGHLLVSSQISGPIGYDY